MPGMMLQALELRRAFRAASWMLLQRDGWLGQAALRRCLCDHPMMHQWRSMEQEESGKASEAVQRTRARKFCAGVPQTYVYICTYIHIFFMLLCKCTRWDFMMGQKLVFTCSHMFVHALVLFEPSLSPFLSLSHWNLSFQVSTDSPSFEPFPGFDKCQAKLPSVILRRLHLVAYCKMQSSKTQSKSNLRFTPKNHRQYRKNFKALPEMLGYA